MMRAKQIIALLLLAMMLTSLSFAVPVIAQEDEAETTVTWNEINTTINKTVVKDVSKWVFGPTLQIKYKYMNDTEIEDCAIGYNVLFKIVAIVPKNMIQENASLDVVIVHLNLKEVNVTARITLAVNVTSGQWLAFARVIDRSEGTYSTEIEDRVYILNTTLSDVKNTTTSYEVEFVGMFGDNAPFGAYNSWFYAIDTIGQKLFPAWIQYTRDDLFPVLILGSPREFSFDVVDANGNPVVSIDYDEQITFRLRASYGNISEATWYFPTGIFTSVTIKIYNPFTGKVVTKTVNVQNKLMFTYNTSGAVDVDVGYDYYTWNSTTKRYEHIYVMNETTNLFTLNTTLSGGAGASVNWTGYFTPEMNPGVFRIFRFEVKDQHGNYIKREEMTTAVGFILGIRTRVLLARTISSATGELINHIDKGVEFNQTIELSATPADISQVGKITYYWVVIQKLMPNRWSRIDFYIEFDTQTSTYSYWYVNSTYKNWLWAFLKWFPLETHDSSQDPNLPELFNVTAATTQVSTRNIYLNYKVKFTDLAYDAFYLEVVNVKTTGGAKFKIPGAGKIIKPLFFRVGAYPDWWFVHWRITPDGAIDLDGDFSTTDDQYYVKQVWNANINKTKTFNIMTVNIRWDPTPGANGDEVTTFAWMGTIHNVWEYSWSQSFIWYYANNMSVVSPATMAQINDTIWDHARNKPRFGYWSISYLTKNVTSDDYQGSVWWLKENKLEWTWFHFHTNQYYRTSVSADSISWSSFKTAYAGLLLFNDTDGNGAATFNVTEGVPMAYEISHVFLINNVSEVIFTRPFDSENATGTQTVTGNQTITFGVTIRGVKGVLLPTRVKRSLPSALKFYLTIDSMVGLDEKDFERYPSRASIDEMSLTVHFTARTTGAGELNNEASIKIDQYIGNWELLDHNTTEMLTNRSLAIVYFAKLSNVTFTFKSGDTPIGSDEAYNASSFSFSSNGTANFADMNFGGSTYIWGKDNNTYTATSASEPYSAFKAIYEIDTGDSVLQWTIDRKTYFMLTSFPNWEGHSITNDPEVVVYSSKEVEAAGPGGEEETGGISKILGFIILGAIVLVIAVVVLKIVRRRRK